MGKHRWVFKAFSGMISTAMVIQTVPALMVPVLAEENVSFAEADLSNQTSTAPQVVPVSVVDDSERSIDFDGGWKFSLGASGNVQNSAYDDSKWDDVTLPHDYSIIQDYNPNLEGESAYLPGGIGWYRKTFTADESLLAKRVRIDFDGVYNNATVYINGHELGSHPYGYTPFSYDITDYLKPGDENLIAVRINHQTPSSRWYSGSGIQRDVTLTVTNDVHVSLDGTRIDSPNLEAEQKGNVTTNIRVNVANDSDEAKSVVLTHTMTKKGSDAVVASVSTEAAAIAAHSEKDIAAVMQVAAPDLWDIADPNLYEVTTEVKVDGKVVDTYESIYGYRYTKFDKDTGFYLNGKAMKVNGVCMHHDQGALGAVQNQAAINRQVRIMKDMGANLIRTSHNTTSKAMVRACQEQGMMLMEEFFDGWSHAKNGNVYDYSTAFTSEIADSNEIIGKADGMTWAEFDLKGTIRRDYNSPAIILWDVGNEVGDYSEYPQVIRDLCTWTNDIDTTRQILFGDNRVLYGSTTGVAQQMREVIAEFGGIIGSNYATVGTISNAYRNRYPDWCHIGSENVSSINSRGIYNTSRGGESWSSDKQRTSYDTSCVSWGHLASDSLYQIITTDWMAGQCVWTGFDYLGEPTPWNGISGGAQGQWPSPKNSYFGITDTAGFPKDSYYLYTSQWRPDVTTLNVLPAWKDGYVEKNNGKVPVVVYSNAASVELFFTPAGSTEKTSLGKKTFTKKTTPAGYTYQLYEGEGKSGTAHKNLYLTWDVTYADGTVTAVAYDEAGHVIDETLGRSYVTTYGDAAALSAKADRTELTADGKDLVYVEVDVKDANGEQVENADNVVTFSVEGEGVLVGVDNGNSPDHQSFQDDNRHAFSGKVLAIVQTTKKGGDITITASAEGLAPASVTVHSSAVEEAPKQDITSFTMSKTIYVKKGVVPVLPETIQANLADGASSDEAVIWEAISADQVAEIGSFTVTGTAAGLPVSMNIQVIDDVAGVLNYSDATRPGVLPVLPSSRPAVMADGTVLSAAFDVNWQMPDVSAFAEAGSTVIVPGTANVMGKTIDVTASIRVQSGNATLQPSMSAAARHLIASVTSDTLNAIKDGSTAFTAPVNGVNQSQWSSYDACQDGNREAIITWGFDTKQNFGKITAYFVQDTWGLDYPEDVKIQIADALDSEEWTDVDVTPEIGAETAYGAAKVRPYVYDLGENGTPMIYVRFVITAKEGNRSVQGGEAIKNAVGITEIEFQALDISYDLGSDAALESLKVNGEEVNPAVLSGNSMTTSAWMAEVEAVGKNNAAITVLPEFEDAVRLIIESEDHSSTKTFFINLKGSDILPADDDSLDVPKEKTTASAESIYSANQPSNVVDGNATSIWHTNWQTSEAEDVNKRRIVLTLDEPTEIEALRQLPRSTGNSGGHNGMVLTYKVEYTEDDSDNWITIAEGDWPETDYGWQIAQFDHPVTAKKVRLTGVHTYADTGNDAHMSVAELRLRKSSSRTSIEEAVLSCVDEIHVYEGQEPEIGEVSVALNGTALREKIDYILATAADEDGNLIVTATGIGKYGGTVSKTVKVIRDEDNRVLESIAIKSAKALYNEGDAFDPAGLVLTLTYDDGSSEEVAYSDENKDDFTIGAPETLAPADTSVTITYKGKSADLPIQVIAAEIPVDFAELEALVRDLAAFDDLEHEEEIKAAAVDLAASMADARNLLAEPDSANQEAVDAAKADLEAKAEALDMAVMDLLASLDLDKINEDKHGKPLAEKAAGLKDLRDSYSRSDYITKLADIPAVRKAIDEPDIPTPPTPSVDKADLKAAIDEANGKAEADYTPESWSTFKSALDEANSVYQNADADQDQVNAAKEALNSAIANLKAATPDNPDDPTPGEKADKAALQAAVDKVKDLKADDYTSDSWSAFAMALKEAKNALDADSISQEAVNSALNNLEAAEKALEKKAADPGSKDPGSKDPEPGTKNPGSTQSPSGTNKPSGTANKANTGVVSAGWMAALGAAVLGTVETLRRRKK